MVEQAITSAGVTNFRAPYPAIAPINWAVIYTTAIFKEELYMIKSFKKIHNFCKYHLLVETSVCKCMLQLLRLDLYEHLRHNQILVS
jgi:hypothetical protein